MCTFNTTTPGFDAIAALFIQYARRRIAAADGRGMDRMNVLAPHIARLFAAMMEKAEILPCWKTAKMSPLYKEGSVLDPRTLACSQSMAPCIGYMLTSQGGDHWMVLRKKDPGIGFHKNQFGLHPGRNTLQPMLFCVALARFPPCHFPCVSTWIVRQKCAMGCHRH
eukprot:1153183-Pelagomonas_calceolata.AAC.1